MNPLNHVAIIMDGNGRWGEKNQKSRNLGHKEGLNTLKKIIKEIIRNNIQFLTLFVFSTDNWKRPQKEVDYLFKLLKNFLKFQLDELIKQNIKIKVLGRNKLSSTIKKLLNKAESLTFKNTKLNLNLAIDYGSREELIYAIKKLKKKNLNITKKNLTNHLYTKNTPDPDILIRTGNTKRLSNFLLWQLSYTEIFFEKKLWPEFNEKDLKKIIISYKKTKRNYGDII